MYYYIEVIKIATFRHGSVSCFVCRFYSVTYSCMSIDVCHALLTFLFGRFWYNLCDRSSCSYQLTVQLLLRRSSKGSLPLCLTFSHQFQPASMFLTFLSSEKNIWPPLLQRNFAFLLFCLQNRNRGQGKTGSPDSGNHQLRTYEHCKSNGTTTAMDTDCQREWYHCRSVAR